MSTTTSSKRATKLAVDAICQMRAKSGSTFKEIVKFIAGNLKKGVSKTMERCVLTALKRGEQNGFLRANRGRFTIEGSPTVLTLKKRGRCATRKNRSSRRKSPSSRRRKCRSSRRRKSRSSRRRKSHSCRRRKSRSSRRRKSRSSSRGRRHCKGKLSGRSRRRRSRSGSKQRHSCKCAKRRTRRRRSVSRKGLCVAKRRTGRKSCSQSGRKRQTRSKKSSRKARC